MKKGSALACWGLVLMIVGVLVITDHSAGKLAPITTEGKIQVEVLGERRVINFVNDISMQRIGNSLGLFTRAYGQSVTVGQFDVAVQVDASGLVTEIINQSIGGATPEWAGPTNLEIPQGGYVLWAIDDNYATRGIKSFLARNFQIGDKVQIGTDGKIISVSPLQAGQSEPLFELNNAKMYGTDLPFTTISGRIADILEDHALFVQGDRVSVEPEGKFSVGVLLEPGVNVILVTLLSGSQIAAEQTLIVLFREKGLGERRVFLWIDQAANARRFQSEDSVRALFAAALESGVTDIVLDVKGVEGYVSYQKATLTNRPYISAIKAPQRAGANPELDLLDIFLREGKAVGIRIHAAINAFSEGSILYNEYAVLNENPEWEEQIYHPLDNGEIRPLRQSAYAKEARIAFVNPAHPLVQAEQLRIITEILENYDVDGLVLDRARYDQWYADFSDVSKGQFEQYLSRKGKQLLNWPGDIYLLDDKPEDGPLLSEWLAYRASVISDFMSQTRQVVDRVNQTRERNVELSAYVGSWYQTYYVHGANWASPNFVYLPEYEFAQDFLYTSEYVSHGYAPFLDFLMVGTYQDNPEDVLSHITLGHVVTNGELPLYAGISLAEVPKPAAQKEVFQTALQYSDGIMIFDYSQVNWAVVQASLAGTEYLGDYVLGISNPRDSLSFTSAEHLNENRNAGSIYLYTDEHGERTGTNHFGVEVVVSAEGIVEYVVNQEQAVNWNWNSGFEQNNSTIPAGGFVLSAVDASGLRTLRQHLALSYEAGDPVRAALIHDIQRYFHAETKENKIEIEGVVEVLGPGMANLIIDDRPVSIGLGGRFGHQLDLNPGENILVLETYVDSLLVFKADLHITSPTKFGKWSYLDSNNDGVIVLWELLRGLFRKD